MVGVEPYSTRVRKYIEHNSPDVDIVGVFSIPKWTDEGKSTKLQELLQVGRTVQLDQIIIVLPTYDHDHVQEILLELSPLATHIDFCPGEMALRVKRPSISYIGKAAFYSIQRHPITGWGVVAKRAIDLAFVIPGLIIFSPLMLVIAALIKLSSAGRIFFVQERHGLNNNVIRVLKFRTMTDVKRDGAHQVVVGDKGVTAIGRILRRTSLDELPQMINVLRGDMSLVGPRPHAVPMNEKYADVVRHNRDYERLERYAARHKVKPGITGWAQVNDLRGITDTHEKIAKRVEYDLHYISNWSLWLDIKIILMTFSVVLKGENAH